MAARRFSAIVTENAGPPDGFPRDLMRYYRRCPQTLLPGVPPALFQAVAARPGGRSTYGSGRTAPRARRRSGRSTAGAPQIGRPAHRKTHEQVRQDPSVIGTAPEERRTRGGRGEMPGPFGRSFWRSPIRGPWLTSVLGLILLAGVSVVFVTGLLSYAAYNPGLGRINDQTHGKGLLGFYLFSWPTHPVWLYRLNQGVHVTLGLVLIPILLAKLWSVLPKLFEWPPLRSPAHALERLSLLLLVGGAVFEFVTGILNIQQWYTFPGSFYTLHFYGAWVFVAGFVGPRGPQEPDRDQVAAGPRPGRGNCASIPPIPSRNRRTARTSSARRPPRRRSPGAARWPSPEPARCCCSPLSAGQSLGGPLRRTALLAPHGQDLGCRRPTISRSTRPRPRWASGRRRPAPAGGSPSATPAQPVPRPSG